ncbi:MAG: GtrA family protein [Agriterribacter sp.]
MDTFQMLILKVVKFGIVGISGIGVDFSITWFLKEKLKLNKYFSNAVGFSAAVVTNFILNYLWTFKGTGINITNAFGIFLVIAIIGLLLNTCIIFLTHEKRNTNFYLSKVFAILLVFCWNFSANYFFNFHTTAT